MIKIRYQFRTAEGFYRDEFWLEDDHQLQPADIEAIKQDRLQKWLNSSALQKWAITGREDKFYRKENTAT